MGKTRLLQDVGDSCLPPWAYESAEDWDGNADLVQEHA
jgi:hypothetical protein